MGKLLPNLLVVCVLCASPDPPACVNNHCGEHEWAPPSEVAGQKVCLFVCCLYCCWTHNCAGCSKSEFTMSLLFILQPNPQFQCWSHLWTATERMEKDGKSVYISSCLPHNALYSPSASNCKILNKTELNLIIPYSQSFSVYSSPSQMVTCRRDWQVGWGNPY